MEAAAARLADAVIRTEKVAIFGDYDVDGACSASLLAEYLRACGVPYLIHIPDRITEGYGPNVDAIRGLKERGAEILVTVDCGTASLVPLAEAKHLGLDSVVLDHHQAPAELPETVALVNPNRQDDLSGLGHLCAAGVVFLFLVALNRVLRARGFFSGRPEPDLMASLDLVALATVADVVPLNGLNRAFVRQGLAVMRSRRRVGLAALLDVAGLAGAPECWHLGYLVGPRINAGGRIGDAALGSKLLLTEDTHQAGQLAAELDRLNRERQAIEVAAVADAEAQAFMALDRTPDLPVVITASAEWHPGIVGLIAARTKERYRRPAFAFTLNPDGTATGSGRSVPGVDLGSVVRGAVETGLAIKGGGHTMAAGVTIQATDLERFLAFATERLSGTRLRFSASSNHRGAGSGKRRPCAGEAQGRRWLLYRGNCLPGRRPAPGNRPFECDRKQPARCRNLVRGPLGRRRESRGQNYGRREARISHPGACDAERTHLYVRPLRRHCPDQAAFVYRLGHQPFTLGRGVRLP
jgi:single-stranded-DNA-specific exonuclease